MGVTRKKRERWYEVAQTWKDFISLIAATDHIIRGEEKRGRGKLKKKIRMIRAREPFSNYPAVYLPKKGEAIFVGDTHGDSCAILSVVRHERFHQRMAEGQNVYLVLMGDYADRGKEDVKNLEAVLNLKCKYPRNVYLLRGNHEETIVGQSYGLLGSCIRRFGYENGQYVFQRFNDLFERFPAIAVTANGVMAVHGGIPVGPIKSLLQLKDQSLCYEMRWNDPTEETDNFMYNYRRGNGYLFGRDVFNSFMNAINGSVLIRSHEYVAAGYKFMFDNKLLTIFSNGGVSRESGYRDFILYPKYAKVDLSEPIDEWSTKHVIDIAY